MYKRVGASPGNLLDGALPRSILKGLMNATQSVAAPPPRLTLFEIAVHGLADGLGGYVLLDSLWNRRGQDDLIQAALALLVILLSVAVMGRRFRPEIRGLRFLELGLSDLVTALGVIGAVVTLLFMASGATYKGSSPDAGGMAVMVGFLLFYPPRASSSSPSR
jgi:hypothetical protein